MTNPLEIPVEADETEEIEHSIKDEDRFCEVRYPGGTVFGFLANFLR